MGILLYMRQGYTRFTHRANNPGKAFERPYAYAACHGSGNPKSAANSIALQYPAKCDRHFPLGLIA